MFLPFEDLKWFGDKIRPWCISMKSWVQTLMNVCINVCTMYIHWCIMHKYDIWNMHDDSEYLQNILLKKSKKYHFINIKSQHVFLLWHAMKNLPSMFGISFFFLILKKLKTRYMMMWHVNLRHITLGVHNIHVNFF